MKKCSLFLLVIACVSMFAVQAGHRITVYIHGTRRLAFTAKGSDVGLFHASSFDPKDDRRKVAQALVSSSPADYPLDHSYAFCWSGKLDIDERKEAAKLLYDALADLVQKYKKNYGVTPHLTLITHSHGGNVALHLADVKKERQIDQQDCPFVVNRLILLACPVQNTTKKNIKDSLYLTKMSFYSASDWFQKIAPQGLYIFSGRLFPSTKNLTQVKVDFPGANMVHGAFVRNRFVRKLPQLIADTERKRSILSLYSISVPMS